MFAHLYADRAASLQDSSLKEVLETRAGVISFAGGLPDEKAFEFDTIADVCGEVAKDPKAWQYAPTEGFMDLREAIAASLEKIGIRATGEHVLITSGSQQGLDLINKIFVNPGDRVYVEAPGYIGSLKAIENYQGQAVPIPLEADGLSVDALQENIEPAKYLYTVPTFQNPAGYTLSQHKREAVLNQSISRGFLIVEDGAYHELRYEGEQLAPIKSMDQAGHVIYLGSFSKTLVPGIRVGWIVAHPEIIHKLILVKQATDLAGGSFGQRFALTWLTRYGIRPPNALYQEKRDRALACLERSMPPGVSWNRAQGGFFLWLTLPTSINTQRLLVSAKARGVSFVPGYAFGGAAHALRFSFSQVALSDIEPGVSRLAESIRNALA